MCNDRKWPLSDLQSSGSPTLPGIQRASGKRLAMDAYEEFLQSIRRDQSGHQTIRLIETAARVPPHPGGCWSQAVLRQAKEHENKQAKLKISSIR